MAGKLRSINSKQCDLIKVTGRWNTKHTEYGLKHITMMRQMVARRVVQNELTIKPLRYLRLISIVKLESRGQHAPAVIDQQ